MPRPDSSTASSPCRPHLIPALVLLVSWPLAAHSYEPAVSRERIDAAVQTELQRQKIVALRWE